MGESEMRKAFLLFWNAHKIELALADKDHEKYYHLVRQEGEIWNSSSDSDKKEYINIWYNYCRNPIHFPY
jgi:hypothetical protein